MGSMGSTAGAIADTWVRKVVAQEIFNQELQELPSRTPWSGLHTCAVSTRFQGICASSGDLLYVDKLATSRRQVGQYLL